MAAPAVPEYNRFGADAGGRGESQTKLFTEHLVKTADRIASQGPHALDGPIRVPADRIVPVAFELNRPWVMLLRICTAEAERPHRVTNLRIREVNEAWILLLWNEPAYDNNNRYIGTTVFSLLHYILICIGIFQVCSIV